MAPKSKQAKRNAAKRPHKAAASRRPSESAGFGVDPNRAVLPIKGYKPPRRAR